MLPQLLVLRQLFRIQEADRRFDQHGREEFKVALVALADYGRVQALSGGVQTEAWAGGRRGW